MLVSSLNIQILDKIFYWTYARPFWQIVLFIFVSIAVWIVLAKFFARNKTWQLINIILAIAVVLVIFYLTIFRRSDTGSHGIYLLPSENFNLLAAKCHWAETLYLNVLLFFPLGLTLPFALAQHIKHKVLITIVICFILSVFIEIIQGVFCLGCVEIFDLIANVIGAALGCLSYCIYAGLQKKDKNN